MNRYRNYMDRIAAPEELADQVLAGKRSRRPHPGLAAGVLAACCLAAAVGGWQLWQGRAVTGQDPAAGVAATPAVTQTVQESGHTLTVADPWEGQAHSFPCVTAYDFPDCTGSDAIVSDYAYPEGWFMERLSAQEIISVLGGTDQVPWVLNWTGFGLDGVVIYDGDGNPWRIDIAGQRGEEELRLELWPGREPLGDLIYADAAVTVVDGVEVSTYSACYDRDGDGENEYVYHARCFDGSMGVEMEYRGPDRDMGPVLVSQVVNQRGSFTAEGLTAPEGGQHMNLATGRLYGSGELTLGQAYQQELSDYLPDRSALPEGFVFESAHWRFDELEDWLSVLWCRGYDDIRVCASRFPASASLLAPDFLPGQVTPQALEELGRYVDDDLGDTPGWRYDSFTVHYTGEDGVTVAVTYTIDGLTPEEAAALVNS